MLTRRSGSTITGVRTIARGISGTMTGLTGSSGRLLSFMSASVIGDFNSFRGVTSSCGVSTSGVGSLMSSFDTASRRLMTSVSGVARTVRKVASTSGSDTTNAAGVTRGAISVTNKSTRIVGKIGATRTSTRRLHEGMDGFIVRRWRGGGCGERFCGKRDNS